jgi:hypothetical protein
MVESFSGMLAVGGRSNSLGRANEVIELVLHNKSRLDELYACLFHADAWVRMRAADALEKVCREHPEWLIPYVDRFPEELATSNQPSIQWHLAQLYRQIDLTDEQKDFAINWLKQLLSAKEVDWIVAANAMDTLAQFVQDGSVPARELITLLKIQEHHRSKAVVKRADKLIHELQA